MGIIFYYVTGDNDDDTSSSGSSTTFVPGYVQYNTTNYTSTPDFLLPIPKEWIIAPLNTTAIQCPSRSANLTTFGVVNLAVVILAAAVGCRPLVHKASRGLLGNRNGSAIRWMWLLNLAVQLLANLLIAYLIHKTPGYEHLQVSNIFALYTARPRVTLLTVALFRVCANVRLSRFEMSKEKETSGSEFVYVDSYTTNAVAEFGMQIASAAFIGVTWSHFANEPAKHWMRYRYKLLQAAPAITFVGVVFSVSIISLGPWALVRSGPPFGLRSQRNRVPKEGDRTTAFFSVIVFIGFGYIMQWVYFSAFLELPGALWCPPNLWSQAGIWIAASTIGTFLGAAS